MILRQAPIEVSYIVDANGELGHLPLIHDEGTHPLIEEEIHRAFEQGRDEGERIGYAKAYEEVHHLQVLLHTLSARLMAYRNDLLALLKPEVIDVAILIAEQFIGTELTQPTSRVQFLQHAITQAMNDFGSQPIKVTVSPEDHTLLQGMGISIAPDMISWSMDAMLSRGECRIESTEGLLHATVAHHIRYLKMKIL